MNQTHSHLRYRPDIDGLRALAVIPVVLFHMGLGCPGGYIGVDIFFVISGFLITSIIIKDISLGSFSMANFWERRIRRILPALAVVVLTTIIGAAIVLYPSQFRDFGKETVAQATLVSNFYFSEQDGYFDAPSEHLPFLHTWSLAVEEQFYLIFPILLSVFHRKKMNLTLWVGILTIASFSWSLYGVKAYPSATFYLLPARAWELFLGALLAFHFARNPPQKKQRPSRFLNELLSWIGLSLIIYSISTYTRLTPFPGFHALAPCLGTVLLIFSSRTHVSSIGKLLSLPPFVGIGKISYSIYLWHWPIMVFVNYSAIGEISIQTRIGLVFCSIILAYISWKWIETPFRKTGCISSQKGIFRFFYISTALFILLGAVIYKTDGMPSRFSSEVLNYVTRDKKQKIKNISLVIESNELPLISNNPDNKQVLPVLLWGDSHARSLLPLFNDLCDQSQFNFYMAPRSGTPPLLGVTKPPKEKILEFNTAVFAFIQNKGIQDVILVARWSQHALGDWDQPASSTLQLVENPEKNSKEAFSMSLHHTVSKLRQLGIRVWIMKQVPLQYSFPPSRLANAIRYGRAQSIDLETLGTPLKQHRKRQFFVNTIIDSLADSNTVILDPTLYLSTPSDYSKIEKNGYSLYYDDDHLSKHGAAELEPLFRPIFKDYIRLHSENK